MAESVQAPRTADAPAPIGPYSQAISAGGWLWCSGQVGLDPRTGRMVGDDVAAQAEQACRNLSAVLAADGCAWPNVVRCTIYLADMGDFAVVNEVYGRHVAPSPSSVPPSRTTIQVAALPLGARVKIDAVAIRP